MPERALGRSFKINVYLGGLTVTRIWCIVSIIVAIAALNTLYNAAEFQGLWEQLVYDIRIKQDVRCM